MSLRGRYVGVTLVALASLGAALVLGLGAASAEPHKSPFRTAQVTASCPPELPCADWAPCLPPRLLIPAPMPPCPVGPPAPAVGVGPPAPTADVGPPAAATSGEPPTPTVAIHVRAPDSAVAGQELEYRITVENTSRAPAHHVLVLDALAAHARFVRATPKPEETGPELVWRLGSLDGGASREIVLVLAPTGGGDVVNCARVQFDHGQCVRTRITRPQLVVSKTGPSEATLNEPVTFRITVTNTGAVEAVGVVLIETLQKGWQLGQKPFEEDRRSQGTWRLGTLAPGKSETVEYQATPRVEGRLCTSADATAAGGLISEPARHCVTVGRRVMTLDILGPRTAYAKRPVNFSITVKNEGSLPATDVTVTDELPEGLEFLDANQGGRLDDRQVRWALGTLAPRQSRILQLQVQSNAERDVRQVPVATYSGGLKASTEITTKFRGAAGFDFDVEADKYAVEVDTPVRYTATVFNRGTAAQTNVAIVFELPPELEFKEARGPAGLKYRIEKGVVTFEPLASLAANAKDAVYQVDAVARKVGSALVQVGFRAGAAEKFTFKSALTQIGEKQPP